MKSSLLADPMMRGCLCQHHATAAEISILVEQQPGEKRAQIPALGLLSGGKDSLFRMVTSADKCESAESLKYFQHMAEMFFPTFSLQTASPNFCV